MVREFKQLDIVKQGDVEIKSCLRKNPKTPGRLVKLSSPEEQASQANSDEKKQEVKQEPTPSDNGTESEHLETQSGGGEDLIIQEEESKVAKEEGLSETTKTDKKQGSEEDLKNATKASSND